MIKRQKISKKKGIASLEKKGNRINETMNLIVVEAFHSY